MSTLSVEKIDEQRLAFATNSVLELLVPQATQLNLETYVKDHAGQTSQRLRRREVLLFGKLASPAWVADVSLIFRRVDELLSVHVLLRSSVSEAILKSLLKNLEILISAHATSSAPPSNPGANPSSAPKAPAKHPGQRLHKPVVHFTASANFRKVEQAAKIVNPDDEYLTSASPTPEDLLQSLQLSPAYIGREIRLPVSRIQKVAPRSTLTLAETKPLKSSSKMFPVVPAMILRVNYTQLSTYVLASLDTEATRYVNCDIALQSIEASATDLLVQSLVSSPSSTSPRVMNAGDRSAFVYKLSQLEKSRTTESLHANRPKPLTITINATATLSPETTATLSILWHGIVPLVQTSFKPLRTWQRQAGLVSPTTEAIQRPPTRPSSMAMPDPGVTFAVTGPESVTEGETFHLTVFIVNRGARKRKLALVAVPRQQRGGHKARPSTVAVKAEGASSGQGVVAEAVLDERTVYAAMAAQSGSSSGSAETVNLNADVRVGPLLPGACHSTQLEFLALSPGTLGLAAVSVVDLETKETVQITDLPDVVVLEKGAKSGQP
ncbi:hypothetical protein H2203_001261 [Taxawa tesnikishii (nom. ined.)]|nr:hypothetical protein H2203_001261 [Dothideales sp. JES 119]